MKKLIDPIKNELNIVNQKLSKTEKQLKSITKKQEILSAEVVELTKEKENLSAAIDSLEGKLVKKIEYVTYPYPCQPYPYQPIWVSHCYPLSPFYTQPIYPNSTITCSTTIGGDYSNAMCLTSDTSTN